jgi:hypothetical protein
MAGAVGTPQHSTMGTADVSTAQHSGATGATSHGLSQQSAATGGQVGVEAIQTFSQHAVDRLLNRARMPRPAHTGLKVMRAVNVATVMQRNQYRKPLVMSIFPRSFRDQMEARTARADSAVKVWYCRERELVCARLLPSGLPRSEQQLVATHETIEIKIGKTRSLSAMGLPRREQRFAASAGASPKRKSTELYLQLKNLCQYQTFNTPA